MNQVAEIEERQIKNVLVLKIKGRLDAISSSDVEQQIMDYIEAGHTSLVLNFSSVNYLSSVGMRLLLRTVKKLKEVSGKMIVCSVNDRVMDILKMSGFDHLIELTVNEEEAIKKLA